MIRPPNIIQINELQQITDSINCLYRFGKSEGGFKMAEFYYQSSMIDTTKCGELLGKGLENTFLRIGMKSKGDNYILYSYTFDINGTKYLCEYNVGSDKIVSKVLKDGEFVINEEDVSKLLLKIKDNIVNNLKKLLHTDHEGSHIVSDFGNTDHEGSHIVSDFGNTDPNFSPHNPSTNAMN